MLKATGVVLAGGQSRRMGVNKALIKIGRSNLLERVASALSCFFQEIVLVSNEPKAYSYLGLPVITDRQPGYGPLGGIHAALLYCRTPYVFVVGCDMPFIDARLGAFLTSQAAGYDAVIPVNGSFLEPLFAVYGQGCIPAIEQLFEKNNCKIDNLFELVKVKYMLDYKLARSFNISNISKVFVNVNTPFDLAKVKEEIAMEKEAGDNSSKIVF